MTVDTHPLPARPMQMETTAAADPTKPVAQQPVSPNDNPGFCRPPTN